MAESRESSDTQSESSSRESSDTQSKESSDTSQGTAAQGIPNDKKRKPKLKSVWAEARHLIWQRRKRLAFGLVLIVIGRLAGLVMPASSKYLIDEVLVGGNVALLKPLAIAVLAATTLQALSSFTLAQTLSIAAQRAITEMRKDVQQHVIRLPVSYFDSTKAGILVSRIMTDAEGIRNLVGTGLVQLIGGVITASLSLVVLFYLNWQMTLVTLSLVLVFGGIMAAAFRKLRPLFRLRGELNARVTGRLTETLGGARIVKSYSAERREDLVFAKGAHELFRNVARTISTDFGRSAPARRFSSVSSAW